MKHIRLIFWIALTALMSGCSSPQQAPYSGVKVGKPYQVYGRTYEPSYDEHYDEIGMASWYGPGFHGGKTASGERFDQYELTAAHRTLPLPSIVRVTNLNNGKSAIVRVNDRGPFAHSRIIDLSKAAAAKLGIIGTGTAKVRVQFLDRETREYAQNVGHGTAYAMNRVREMAAGGAIPGGSVEVVQQAEPLPTHVTMQSLPQPASYEPVQPDIFSVVDNAYAAPSTPGDTAIAATGRAFFVQAGTFGAEENARRLLAKLENLGSSQVMEIMAKGKKLYRVMIGPYNAQMDAKNMLSKLTALGISDARIIRN